MSSATNYPIPERKKLLSSEITSIEIYSDQKNNRYFIGEDVTITAKFGNPFAVLCVSWQFNANGSSSTINTSLPKYAGTRYENNKHLLIIGSCCQSDAGEYSLVATCKENVDICSAKLQLKVVEGRPEVALNEEVPAVFHERAEIKATIRSFPKHNCVIWKKGNDPIDINLPKYEGSSDVGDCPVLCINNAEEEDEGVYTIEVRNEFGKETSKLELEVNGDLLEVALNKEISAIFDERAEIKATIRSFLKHNCVKWKKGDDPIDINLPKYAGSSDVGDCPVLCINNVKEEDEDAYTIEVQNKFGEKTDDRKLVVKRGLPEVVLNEGPSAVLNECVEFKATIRSFPKHHSVLWKKGDDPIDITLPKYKGSSDVGDCPVLCINNIKEEDEAAYTIEVQNECGKGIDTEKLKVIGVRQMIFISGPLVVSPSDMINIQANLFDQKLSNAKWWKTKDSSPKEIEFDDRKYFTYQSKKIQKIEIHNADKEDSAVYQLSMDGTKSNKINVFVDDSGKFSTSKQGNCLRLFALQSVSADAMRKAFHNPDDFKDMKNKLTNQFKYLQQNSNIELKNADITLMYLILKRNVVPKPKNGWGKLPGDNNIGLADDIERIHHYRNLVCHSDASGIETVDFNKSVLDLVGAIRRLSEDNIKMIEDTCDILNKVFTKGKDMDIMMKKLENFKKEQKTIDESLLNESLLKEECDKSTKDAQVNTIILDVCTSATQTNVSLRPGCVIS